MDNDGKKDIVAFGVWGVYIYYSTGIAFEVPLGISAVPVQNFGYGHNFRNTHIRTTADMDNNGFKDIVGIRYDGVYVALNNGNYTFEPVRRWTTNFSGWTPGVHPQFITDINCDGSSDIAGFGDAGLYTALSNTTSFNQTAKIWGYMGAKQGWRANNIRLLKDINNDGCPDIIGFGYDSVFISLNDGTGNFQTTPPYFTGLDGEFGSKTWNTSQHNRFIADVLDDPTTTEDDNLPDIIGFHERDVIVSQNMGNGLFADPVTIIENRFTTFNGWVGYKGIHDINNDGCNDIVSTSQYAIHVAFMDCESVTHFDIFETNYATRSGWNSNHSVFFGDVTGNNKPDIVGFPSYGVTVTPNPF